jgi:hypothetical protein
LKEQAETSFINLDSSALSHQLIITNMSVNFLLPFVVVFLIMILKHEYKSQNQ